jgi:hypothetical protein
MVYELPFEQLVHRFFHLQEEAEHDYTGGVHLEAEALYHGLCAVAKSKEIPEEDNAVQEAEKWHQRALSSRRIDEHPARTAYEMEQASSILFERLFPESVNGIYNGLQQRSLEDYAGGVHFKAEAVLQGLTFLVGQQGIGDEDERLKSVKYWWDQAERSRASGSPPAKIAYGLGRANSKLASLAFPDVLTYS